MSTHPSGMFARVCPLAEGGMARVDVVLRREGGFERLYAMKRLQPAHRDDDYFRAMFLDEARIAGLIRHANVVSVLDVGDDDEGPYLLMDYVEGVSLADLLRELEARDEGLHVELCARIAAQIAHGLHAAHELATPDGQRLHLVHRDVSPQNVLIGYDGVVRVTDFGIAKALGQSTRTATGVLKGKFGYMSPEQLRYEEPDRRSDLFSLGVVFYELLSGERLYRNTDGMDGVRRILDEPPPDIGEVRDDVPPELVELTFEVLAKDKEARPATALDVARRLEGIVAQQSATEGPIDLGGFVSHIFAARRDGESARIAEALRRLDSETKTSGAVAMTAAPENRRRGAWWGAGIAAAAVAAAVVASSLHRPQEIEVAAPSASVTLIVDSDPSDARVTIGGEQRGRTPLRVDVARDDAALLVAIDKDGYARIERSVAPRADQTLHVLLTPLASSAPPSDSTARPAPRRSPVRAAPSASSGLFRRFD